MGPTRPPGSTTERQRARYALWSSAVSPAAGLPFATVRPYLDTLRRADQRHPLPSAGQTAEWGSEGCGPIIHRSAAVLPRPSCGTRLHAAPARRDLLAVLHPRSAHRGRRAAAVAVGEHPRLAGRRDLAGRPP